LIEGINLEPNDYDAREEALFIADRHEAISQARRSFRVSAISAMPIKM
jgi:hypothetical protein